MFQKKPQAVQPPVKANMIIVRGRNGKEVRGEDWGRVEHEVYMTLIPKRVEGGNSYYDVVALVPGKGPVTCEGVIYRGCNCIAVSPAVCNHL